ncbi:MAG: peptide chain release factor 2 [Brevinematia bacterium]
MGFLLEKAEEITKRIEENFQIFQIPSKVQRIDEISHLISEAYSKNDIETASKLLIEQTNLKREIEKWLRLKKEVDGITEIILEVEKGNDTEIINEIQKSLEKIFNQIEDYEIEKFFDPIDNSNCFINIHPGAGGVESCDWASMILRMYIRYFERKGFKYEIVDLLPDDVAGIKDVTIYLSGEYAFGYLKSETGIHRLVRISPFDASKRRHTSFAAVHIIPEIKDESEIKIDPSEIKIETFRAGGKGGQHVNKTESAVRITHIPTGIVVSIQNERSQTQNKELAMKILKSKLYELKERENKEKTEEISGEKKDISWGNQIRSYILHPYNSVKDHRTGVETSNAQAVLDGEIDIFIKAYIKWYYLNKAKVK